MVLRRWPYSETSQVVRMLTPEHGVLPMLAKGVNKLTSGQAGVLDTWALVEADFGGPDNRSKRRRKDRLGFETRGGLTAPMV